MNKSPLLIATSNTGKIVEIQIALTGLPIHFRYLDEFPAMNHVEESGMTYEENAILKAEGYAHATGIMSLADDSGLEVDALGGRPGVHTARYAGASDEERVHRLLAELNEQAINRRSATFVSCAALVVVMDGKSQMLHVTRGECSGTIANEARGTNGFGYDPIFIPEGYTATFAELSNETKQRISHRAIALGAMSEFLKRYLLKLDRSYTAT